MADKIFSEGEVGDLMRRAAELQEQGSSAGYVPGVTYAEIAKMASEIGIDAKYLELAIQERKSPDLASQSREKYPTIERIFPIELQPENMDIITEYIKPLSVATASGTMSGSLVQVGRTLRGQAACTWANPEFRVTSRDGRTKVVVTSDKGTPIGLTCLWIIPLIAVIVMLAKGVLIPAAALGVLSIALAIWSYHGLVRKSGEMTYEVANSIEKSITEYIESQSQLSSSTLSSGTSTQEDELQQRTTS